MDVALLAAQAARARNGLRPWTAAEVREYRRGWADWQLVPADAEAERVAP